MTRSVIVTLCAIGFLLLAPLGAFAQRLDLKMFPLTAPVNVAWSRPPTRAPGPVRPSATSTHTTAAPGAPGFMAPLGRRTGAGQAGGAGWTAPNTPVGSRGAADPDIAGWLGFDFAAEWGGQPRQKWN